MERAVAWDVQIANGGRYFWYGNWWTNLCLCVCVCISGDDNNNNNKNNEAQSTHTRTKPKQEPAKWQSESRVNNQKKKGESNAMN